MGYTYRSNRGVVVVPLAMEDLDLVAHEDRLVAPEGYLEVHGSGEEDEGLSLALGLGVLAGVENDDVEDDEALEEGHDVLEVDVVRDAPDAGAGEGAENVLEGVHGRCDPDGADVGIARFAFAWAGSADAVGVGTGTTCRVLVVVGVLLLLLRGLLLLLLLQMRRRGRSGGQKVLKVRGRSQTTTGKLLLETGPGLLLRLTHLLTTEVRS